MRILISQLITLRTTKAFLAIAAIIIICKFLIDWILFSANYTAPLGYDGYLFNYSIGEVIAKTPLRYFFQTLIASFRFEDHLYPVVSLFSFILYKFSPFSIELSHNVLSKVFVLSNFAVLVLIVNRLWNCKTRNIFAFALIALNVDIGWRIMIDNSGPLPTILGLLCLLWLVRYFQTLNKKDLYLFFIFFFLLAHSFENSFAMFPVFVIFIIDSTLLQKVNIKLKAKTILSIGAVMFGLFLPYLLIHYHIFGTFIPSSRASLTNQGLGTVFRVEFSKALFNIPNIVTLHVNNYIPLLTYLLLSLGFIKNTLFSRKTLPFYISLIVQLLIIATTGRADDFLWAFPGLMVSIIFADLFYHLYMHSTNLLKKIRCTQNFAEITVSLLFISLLVSASFGQRAKLRTLEKQNWVFNHLSKHVKKATTALFKTLEYGHDKFTVIRLSRAVKMYQAEAMWLGSRHYYNKQAFNLFPEGLIFYENNIGIEFYQNLSNRPNSFFSQYLKATQGQNKIVSVKDSTHYARLYLNMNDHRIFKAVFFDSPSHNQFQLYIPNYKKSPYQNKKVVLKLNFLGKISLLDKIIFNNKQVDFIRSGQTAEFEYSLSSINSEVSFSTIKNSTLNQNSNLTLDTLEISYSGKSKVTNSEKPLGDANYTLLFHSPYSDCRFIINIDNFEYWGAIRKNKTKVVKLLIPPLKHKRFFNVYYTPFTIPRARANKVKRFDTTTPIPSKIEVCSNPLT
ncbi:MAG: hypothetical protein ISR65_07755 [Bacteriovoracaceae bacterium]|nr:hypothetical protein [Bacteriovoracaceae bacterium]